MKKVLFIDRDGTLALEPADYQLDAFEKLVFYPEVFTYLGKIAKEMDYEFVMVTNQDGLGTDSFPEDTFWPAQNKIISAFGKEGVVFSEILIDKSFPHENAETRKPRTGLLTKYFSGDYDLENSFDNLKTTFKNLSSYRRIFHFLLARLVYNDALITIFAFGGIYAATAIGFSFEEIIILGIVLNVMAGIGAFVFGYLEDGKGSEKVILWSIFFLMIACLISFLAPELPGLFQFIFGGNAIPDWFNSKKLFWVAAILIGLFSGPNQSASRTYMARLTPAEKRNEFFGFYALSGKMTAFVGPFLFGLATRYFDTQQAGLIVIFILFFVGYKLMKRL